jgi:hypothetical protein
MIKKLHYTYTVCLLLLLLSARQEIAAQTTLLAGDIVVLGFNADDAYPNERWAFMTMKFLAAGTIIHFTDKGYDNTIPNFRAPNVDPAMENDGYMSWQVQTAVPAGTVIYATNNTINGTTTGVTGNLGSSSNGFGFSTSGDQIIVYQGTSGTAAGATFIYALNTGQFNGYTGLGTWTTSGVVDQDYLSYLPPGLTNGTTALALTSTVFATSSGPGTLGTANYGFDNMVYGATTSGTKAQLLTAMGSPANWIGNNAGGFTIASGSGVFPGAFSVLPVTLLHFNAEEATGGVKLTWSTAMEVNNDHFTLERSSDGLHYTLIGTVPGKGDNNQPVDYSFTDPSPEQGSNYYRLTQFDRDGRSKILGTKMVNVQEIALRVGPNPAINFVDIVFASGAWREIKLYNSAEQLLQTISPAAGTSRLKIGLQNYRPGTYYIAFIGNSGQGNAVRRFVKRE